ncbi:hypothetical protein ACF0H5_022761 [Mactra antiquata]
MAVTCTLFHFLAFILYAFTLFFNIRYIGNTDDPYYGLFTFKGYAGKFKYLTFICLIIQTVFFGLALVNDIWGTNVRPSEKGAKKCRLQQFMDTFLSSIAYPVGTFVVMTFWGIYAVDRELVYPKRLDKIIPLWLNHVEHTVVLPILLIEKFLVFHEYPRRRKGLFVMLAFASSYLLWILWVAYYADIWVYPILQVMESHQRAIFISIMMVFFVSIYILGESINRFLWRREMGVKNVKTDKYKVKKKTT